MEKAAAACEGAIAAGTAWQSLMLSAFLRPPSLAGLADGLIGVMDEAARPARRRVKANAKRLTRRPARRA